MNKKRIIEILEDYEYFVDDDYGGSYQHIDCSQRACTPMGILQILDYIDKLESNWKALKEWLEKDAFKNLESKGIALTTDEVLNQMAKIELEGDK